MGLARTTLCAVVVAGAAGVTYVPGAEGRDAVSIPAAAVEIARLPEVSFELMRQELDTLLDGSGVGIRWRRAGAASETGADELRVVFLDGPGRGLYADRPVLAASRHADPGPTIWVYTPTVRAALERRPREGADSLVAQRDLGVALGRVLAHELVHVLAPEIPHGHGVMADRFRLVALDQTRPALVPACERALVQGAREWAARGGRIARQEALASGSADASLLSDARP